MRMASQGKRSTPTTCIAWTTSKSAALTNAAIADRKPSCATLVTAATLARARAARDRPRPAFDGLPSRSGDDVEAAEIHHLRPRDHEVSDELLLGVRASVDLRK